MAETTKIEWTHHSWSPWHGCVEVHAGCDNCYARETAKRNPKTLGVWGANGTRVRAAQKGWDAVLRWDREAGKAGVRERVFPSICDVFEDWQGPVLDHKGNVLQMSYAERPVSSAPDEWWVERPLTLDDLRRNLFALIDATPNLDWLILTKRPENIRRMWPKRAIPNVEYFPFEELANWHPDRMDRRKNVWLLTSVSDQPTADAAIPELLKCRDLAPVLGVSYEPALGPVDFSRWLNPDCDGIEEACESGYCDHAKPAFDWIIYGGESGAHARPADVAWARSTVEQCRAANVPVFVKQLGAWSIAEQRECCGKKWISHYGPRYCPTCGDLGGCGIQKLDLLDKKGGDWTEWPEGLRVREFPRPELTHAS